MDQVIEYKRVCMAILDRLEADPSSDPSTLFEEYERALKAVREAAEASDVAAQKAASLSQTPEMTDLLRQKKEANEALLHLANRLMQVDRSADLLAGLPAL